MPKSSMIVSVIALSLAAASSAGAAPYASVPSATPVAPLAEQKAELQKAHHAPYHYCGWTRDRWGRPYYTCWWDKRLRRRGWY